MSNEDVILPDPYDEISDIAVEWAYDYDLDEQIFSRLVLALCSVMNHREATLCEAWAWEEKSHKAEADWLRSLLREGVASANALSDAIEEERSTARADTRVYLWLIAVRHYFDSVMGETEEGDAV